MLRMPGGGSAGGRVSPSAGAAGHAALFYADLDEYVAGTLAFLRAGLTAGARVAVAVPPPRLECVRDALGPAGRDVRFIDMAEAGRNPGRIIPSVLCAVADAGPAGPVRIVAESTWTGRSTAEYPACVQHEALVDRALSGRSVSVLCPYDATRLPHAALADAWLTHPTVMNGRHPRRNDRYAPGVALLAMNLELAVPQTAVTVAFDGDTFHGLRRIVVERARSGGTPPDRLNDVAVAVSELATNAVVHGGGAGLLRSWTDDRHFICEVVSTGRIADVLAGRRPVPPTEVSGRGILLVNMVADLVRMHVGDGGTTVRFYILLSALR
ncbi:anti-sigma factor RsbA family regulatory protein [Nucisporomicrobium flavum]|uniref:sensor histidine kinase n=1 Tax=Nucisporomicrobium flavum TaxID=2785915 RepID=UPI0018F2C9AC|nr:sensor histidine kinase [Nucisporomicrobium flavum]